MPSGYANREWQGKFCGVYEIAAYAEVSKAQVTHWRREPWFPKPVDEPKMGCVWDYPAVVKALDEQGYPRSEGRSGRKLGRRKVAETVAAEVPVTAP